MYCGEKDSSDTPNRNSTSRKRPFNCDSDQKPKGVRFQLSSDAHDLESATEIDKNRNRTSRKISRNCVSEQKVKGVRYPSSSDADISEYTDVTESGDAIESADVLESGHAIKSPDVSATAVGNRNSTSIKMLINCDSERKLKDTRYSLASDTNVSESAFADVLETVTSHDVPESATSDDVPESATSDDVPESATSDDVPESATSDDVPESATSDDVPESATSDDVPESATSDDVSESVTSDDVPESTTDIPNSKESSLIMKSDIKVSIAESEKRFKCVVSNKMKAVSLDKYWADVEDNVESSATASEEWEDPPFKRRHVEVEDVFVQSSEIIISEDQKDVFVSSSEILNSKDHLADLGTLLSCSDDGRKKQLPIIKRSASNGYSSGSGLEKSEKTSEENAPSSGATSNTLKAKSSLSSKRRCRVCNKKVGLTGITCRCGGLFCAKHRYDKEHGCEFDYKALGKKEISKNNPPVIAEKVKKL